MPNEKESLTSKIVEAQTTHPPANSVQSSKQVEKMTENKKLASWIDGCRRMDESSQLKLYQHFYSYGMGISLPYARNRESAMEMVNDGFLKVFTKIDQYDASYPFKPWLRKILVNAAIDHYRKYQKNRPKELIVSVDESPAYNEALDKLEFDDLIEIMQLLTPVYRMVFNLFVVEGLAHAEIADKLGISIGASKSNLSKARQKIKELLKNVHNIHVKTNKYG